MDDQGNIFDLNGDFVATMGDGEGKDHIEEQNMSDVQIDV